MGNRVKVSKFGGSSVANAAMLRKVKAIVKADPSRRVVVVSAPGKDADNTEKVTDQLRMIWEKASKNEEWANLWSAVTNRFIQIAKDLGLKTDLSAEFGLIEERILQKKDSLDFVESRGEYLSALLAAEFLGFEFVDAADVIFFGSDGKPDVLATYAQIARRCGGMSGYVIPGYYGTHNNKPKTFPRGGSDISGAIVAAALDADLYENWSDSAVRAADPRVVPGAQVIRIITYEELAGLSYRGASVFHPEAVGPVREKGIPTRVLDTNNPDDRGTLVVHGREVTDDETIVGTAGRGGFVVYSFSMAGMNERVGFANAILGVFSRLGISIDHPPTGMESLSVAVSTENLDGKSEKLWEDLHKAAPNCLIQTFPKLGFVTAVGLGMAGKVGCSARITRALARAGVNDLTINHDIIQTSVVVGVHEEDVNRAVEAIYHEFFG